MNQSSTHSGLRRHASALSKAACRRLFTKQTFLGYRISSFLVLACSVAFTANCFAAKPVKTPDLEKLLAVHDFHSMPKTSAGLQLNVSFDVERGTTETFHFHAQLKNPTQKTVKLFAIRYPHQPKRSLEEFLVSCTNLTITPRVNGHYFGSVVSPEFEKVVYSIPAMTTVEYGWDSYCNCLHKAGSCLPEPGQYSVEVGFSAREIGGKGIVLKAPQFTLNYDGSTKPANPTFIKITDLDMKTSSARVIPGKTAGIKVGQEFLNSGKWPTRLLRIIEAKNDHCLAEIIVLEKKPVGPPELRVGSVIFRKDQVMNNGRPDCETSQRHD